MFKTDNITKILQINQKYCRIKKYDIQLIHKIKRNKEVKWNMSTKTNEITGRVTHTHTHTSRI